MFIGMKYILLALGFFLLIRPASSQEVFRLEFDREFVPEDWAYSDKSEWAHRLGEGGTSYFRFHPFSYRDFLQSPVLELEAGHYVLYFSWNESRRGNPDFCNVRIRPDGGFWDIVHTFGSGNDRIWERDSAVLGNLPAGIYQVEFEYKSLPRYPAQYLNLDNVSLVRRDQVVTGSEAAVWLQGMELYPNPAASRLNYSLDAVMGRPDGLRVLNGAGQVLLESGNPGLSGALDVSSLAPGHYFLEIEANGERASKPFVILR